MEHSFDIEIAKEYGIKPAILLKNIYYWIEKNKANCVHFYDDKYWTYNSKSAFAKLFPYMNARQIDYAIKKLIENGLIITGNFNEQKYDRTLWYSITKKGYSILQNCEMDETKFVNAKNKNVKPILNINKNNKTNNNIYISEFSEIWKLYPRKIGKESALKSYIKARNSGVECETIKNAVVKYAEYCKGREPKYIKHGSTWFNQKGWEDVYEEPKKEKFASYDLDLYEKMLNEKE